LEGKDTEVGGFVVHLKIMANNRKHRNDA
jgi:hypothetical protein